MNVEFLSTKYSLDAGERAALTSIVRNYVKDIGLDEDVLSSVVLTDEANYGAAISSIEEGATFTNTPELVGFGKTICVDQRTGKSAVVIRLELLLAMLFEVTAEGEDMKFTRQAVGVLAHELGHVKDHVLRPSSRAAPTKPRGAADVERCAEFHGFVIESEFAACAHAAQVIEDAEAFLVEFDRFEETLRTSMATIAETRSRYLGTEEQLLDVLCDCQKYAWFVLAQFAKLVGTSTASPDMRGLMDERLSPALTGYEQLKSLEVSLQAMWIKYPQEEGLHTQRYFQIFADFLLAQGYWLRRVVGGWDLKFN